MRAGDPSSYGHHWLAIEELAPQIWHRAWRAFSETIAMPETLTCLNVKVGPVSHREGAGAHYLATLRRSLYRCEELTEY